MKVRLFLSFAIVVLVAIISVVLITGRGVANEVQSFVFSGSPGQVDQLVQQLENYYNTHGSWQGVEALLPSETAQPTGTAQPAETETPAGQAAASVPARKIPLSTPTPKGKGSTTQAASKATAKASTSQHVRLLDKNGKVILDTSAIKPTPRLAQDIPQAAKPIQASSGETVGYLTVTGSASLSSEDSNLLVNRLYRSAVIAGVIAGGIALVLAFLLANRLTRPILHLTDAANKLAQGDLSQQVEIHGKDELAHLGQAFNQMAGALKQAEVDRRAMTADIAHELRNPLAVQRADLEALQDGVFPTTPENLQPVLDQNLLLTRLVEDLRTLALADSGQLRLERTSLNIIVLVQQIVDGFTPQAVLCGVELVCETSKELIGREAVVNLDSQRFEQILGNLLSNALRFTPEGGKIIVQTTRVSEMVQVSVWDSGPGIPVEAIPHIFDRFYRADRSRARSEGGSGLGLTIARQLTIAHGGSLTAENAAEGGAIFTIRLPMLDF